MDSGQHASQQNACSWSRWSQRQCFLWLQLRHKKANKYPNGTLLKWHAHLLVVPVNPVHLRGKSVTQVSHFVITNERPAICIFAHPCWKPNIWKSISSRRAKLKLSQLKIKWNNIFHSWAISRKKKTYLTSDKKKIKKDSKLSGEWRKGNCQILSLDTSVSKHFFI